MLNTLAPRLARAPLPDLGAVRVHGADAVQFLQGQLSNDVALLGPGQPLLAGLHNPQGRVIALLRLIALAPDDVLALLPRGLAAPVAARLAKFVLRAKAKIGDVSEQWSVCGLIDSPSSASPSSAETLAGDARSSAGSAQALSIALDPRRRLIVTPSAGARAESDVSGNASDIAARERWRALDIAAGLPQVYPSTSEQFVAQMLNLDVLGAISFTKGCYTGQEVIARAHYRGRVKRRMQRFRTLSPARLAPGEAGTLQDGRSFRVVDAAVLEDGRCEFLAVAPTAHAGAAEGTEPDTTGSAGQPAAAPLDAEQLSLPYELPA